MYSAKGPKPAVSSLAASVQKQVVSVAKRSASNLSSGSGQSNQSGVSSAFGSLKSSGSKNPYAKIGPRQLSGKVSELGKSKPAKMILLNTGKASSATGTAVLTPTNQTTVVSSGGKARVTTPTTQASKPIMILSSS